MSTLRRAPGSPARVPLHFMEDYTGTGFEVFVNGSGGAFGLKQDTDLPPGHPPASTDCLIAPGTFTGYGLGNNVVKVAQDGVYHTNWYGFVRMAAADTADWVAGQMYLAIDDESYGPHYWTPDWQTVLSDTSGTNTITCKGSVTCWLPAGTEFVGWGEFNMTTEPQSAGFHGSIVRID